MSGEFCTVGGSVCGRKFALLGLVVVEAVQSSPCWRKMRRKEVFRACWESFVPVSPARVACWESFVPVSPAGGACRESFVPVEASWHGARGRCESTVGTKGPAARAVGRMGASVSVVLGITGRCPAISHAIPREYHAGLYQFMMLRHLYFGISCEIGGGACYWGEVACWARTGKEGGGVCWQRG